MLSPRWQIGCHGSSGSAPPLRQLRLPYVIARICDKANFLCSHGIRYDEDVNDWNFGKLSALREIALALEGGYRYYYMGTSNLHAQISIY